MMNIFHEVCQQSSRITTERYSTSFSSAIRLLHPDLRKPIYNIYGLVRFADEIVDTFHEHDKATLIAEFRKETFEAIERGISLNPILHSFQLTVNQYRIDHALIHAFFNSMEMDLEKKQYSNEGYNEYIYGSAEVVGLMCLYVFVEGDQKRYDQLKSAAQSLGAAFQKVNFLRDVKADYNQLDRTYFPGLDFCNFTDRQKQEIETDIQKDFDAAFKGIMQLPPKARFGVYVAYKYYLSLFAKIKKLRPTVILQQRVRISDYYKIMILLRAGVRSHFNIL
ncbi:phytoene/squalene synthase family protein [Lacibacter luteus]|uniref:Phytoene/squalene synthase family protein n=1 Tax=Lacibacter luteus TaxID=2508719 RepID=A0A4Q1CH34_9BACT|nr:phytoene/squalene synthase family protein [Lacibacter luteus]RXK59432.1 phytoene/squalene synthase family protein [Lacibacter luteus]